MYIRSAKKKSSDGVRAVLGAHWHVVAVTSECERHRLEDDVVRAVDVERIVVRFSDGVVVVDAMATCVDVHVGAQTNGRTNENYVVSFKW